MEKLKFYFENLKVNQKSLHIAESVIVYDKNQTFPNAETYQLILLFNISENSIAHIIFTSYSVL